MRNVRAAIVTAALVGLGYFIVQEGRFSTRCEANPGHVYIYSRSTGSACVLGVKP